MKTKLAACLALLGAFAFLGAKAVWAQTPNFSQMNGLQPIAPQENQSFQMSPEDMDFSPTNDMDYQDPNFSLAPQQEEMLEFPSNNVQNSQNVIAEPSPTKNNLGINSLSQAQTLTDALQQNTSSANDANAKEPSSESKTWIDQLKQSIPETLEKKSNTKDNAAESGADQTLENLVNGTKNINRRSNASVFDISGVMLRMNLAQTQKALLIRGFKPVSQHLEIPNFIKWRNEEKCRNNGVIGYERVMNCVVEMAKKNGYQYVETAKFTKYDTKEEIEVKFTSNFTQNKVYRIMYKSMSREIKGSGAKAAYLYNIKVYDFWKKVNQKYGSPDNKEEVSWGLGANKPYMKAATGFLLLEDPMLRELDYTRMSREDQRFMNTDLYSF